jgi:hypothetical protein
MIACKKGNHKLHSDMNDREPGALQAQAPALFFFGM